MGWVQFFLAESQSRLYPHMRAKFGRDPTAGSNKLPFKFISRLCSMLEINDDVFFFIAFHCIALHCIALHCIALHCIALHCIALHCIALHCIALHCIALHCIALHCIALICLNLRSTGNLSSKL